MSDVWIPLLSGFAGVLVGSVSSILITVISTRSERRRERSRLAVQAGIADHAVYTDHAKIHQQMTVPPLSLFIHYHMRVLDLLDAGKLNAEAMRHLNIEQDQMIDAAYEIAGKRRPRPAADDSGSS